MRIGHGFDVHAFTEGDFIILGGVKIPHRYSFKAHSDGDVLLHALCDSLLGAISQGDIGRHFPDDDMQYKNINSMELLKNVYDKININNFEIINIDTIIVCQEPKMSPHIEKMKKNISSSLGNIKTEQISIKATTTEGLGYTGRGEGIASYSVVLLNKAV